MEEKIITEKDGILKTSIREDQVSPIIVTNDISVSYPLLSEESDEEDFRARTPSGTLLSSTVKDLKVKLIEKFQRKDKLSSQIALPVNSQQLSAPHSEINQLKPGVNQRTVLRLKGRAKSLAFKREDQGHNIEQNKQSRRDSVVPIEVDFPSDVSEIYHTPSVTSPQTQQNSEETKFLYYLASTLKMAASEKSLQNSESDQKEMPSLKGTADAQLNQNNKMELSKMLVEENVSENPEMVGVQTVQAMFQEIRKDMAAMQNEITQLRSKNIEPIKEKVVNECKDDIIDTVAQSVNDAFESEFSEISKLKEELRHFKFRNRTLTDVVDAMHTEIADLKTRIEGIELNSAKYALSISNLEIDDTKREGILQLKNFIADFLGLNITVEDFYKLGSSKSRLIVFFLQTMQQKRDILRFKKLLKDERNRFGMKYYINDYVPAATQEKRRKERELVQQCKAESLSTEYVKGKLTIQGSPFKQKVVPPSPKDLVDLKPEELKKVLDRKLQQNGRVTQDGSIFEGYTTEVETFQQVRELYIKVRLMQPGARHIICAYWLNDENPHYCHDYCNDGEPGAGRRLMDYMIQCGQKNRVIFISRKYGGVRMGVDRFECYLAAAKTVVKANSWNSVLKLEQSTEPSTVPRKETTETVQKEKSDAPENQKRPASSPPGGSDQQFQYRKTFRHATGRKYAERPTTYGRGRGYPPARGSRQSTNYGRQHHLNTARGRYAPQTFRQRYYDDGYDDNPYYEDWSHYYDGRMDQDHKDID